MRGERLEKAISCPKLGCQEGIKLGIEPETPNSKIHIVYHKMLHYQLDLPESISSIALILTVGRIFKFSVEKVLSDRKKRLNLEASTKYGGRLFPQEAVVKSSSFEIRLSLNLIFINM